MAYCLKVPSHYLNQYWLIIKGVCGIHLSTISQEMLKILILEYSLKITQSKLQPHLPGANELMAVLWHLCQKYSFSFCNGVPFSFTNSSVYPNSSQKKIYKISNILLIILGPEATSPIHEITHIITQPLRETSSINFCSNSYILLCDILHVLPWRCELLPWAFKL